MLEFAACLSLAAILLYTKEKISMNNLLNKNGNNDNKFIKK